MLSGFLRRDNISMVHRTDVKYALDCEMCVNVVIIMRFCIAESSEMTSWNIIGYF